MKSTTSATLDRLRLIVECADLTPADLRHRKYAPQSEPTNGKRTA